MPYTVTAKSKAQGIRIKSRTYKTRAQAQKHCSNTKKYWKGLFSNPRIVKVKK